MNIEHSRVHNLLRGQVQGEHYVQVVAAVHPVGAKVRLVLCGFWSDEETWRDFRNRQGFKVADILREHYSRVEISVYGCDKTETVQLT